MAGRYEAAYQNEITTYLAKSLAVTAKVTVKKLNVMIDASGARPMPCGFS
jgi:hypothetical protein